MLLDATKTRNFTIKESILLDADSCYQQIDGFGLNVTPSQWKERNLKHELEMLNSDLGSTIIRFDCYGKANWLIPSKRD